MASKNSSFFRAFQFIDIFGLKTDFQIDRKPKFKSISGGVFTFVFMGFIILLFFSFGNDMINHSNPDTSVSQIFQPSPSPTFVSKSDYSFVFGLQDSVGVHYIDEEIYTATLTYGFRNQTSKLDESQIIPIERCEEANMPINSKLGDYFKNQAMQLSDLYCISRNYTDPLILQGAWDQAQYNFLRLFISPCDSSLRTCKSDAEINDKLKTGFYAYYSSDHLFDLRNYENPAAVIGRDFFTETTTKIKKIINRYLRTTHLYDDNGWITEAKTEKDYFSFDYDQTSFELLTGKDYLVDMVIRKSVYENILTRKYKKIQNVFAEMTGFLQIIFAGLYIIAGPFIRKEYYDTLTNDIYNFEVDLDAKKKKDKKKRGEGAEEKMKSFKTIMMGSDKGKDFQEMLALEKGMVSNSKKKKKTDEELVNCIFKLKESPLKFSYFEILKGFLTKEPELEVKKTQRNVGISSILSQLDIKYILKKFAEIDQLKILVLNEDQYPLFEYLQKPIIMKNAKINLNPLEEQDNDKKNSIKDGVFRKKSQFIVHQHDSVLKAKTVQKAFENIINKPEMNEIDRKLIQRLDMDILKILEANIESNQNNRTSNFIGQVNENPGIEMESKGNAGKESEFSEKKEEIIVERNAELMNTFKSMDSLVKVNI